jgi:acetyl esterase/lipase
VILAIHGGGFVSGSIATHRRMFGHLARAAGAAVLLVDYGLVPEHVYPAQLDQVQAAYRTLDGRRVVVAGDSCGATLVLGLALRTRDQGRPAPAGLLLFSAWAGLIAQGDSFDTGSDPFFSRELVTGLAHGYLAGADPRDPVASPVHADLHGLPPTYLQVGAEEALRDVSRVLARRMAAAGVDVRLDEFPGQLHTFQLAAGRSPAADEAIRRAGAWVRERW